MNSQNPSENELVHPQTRIGHIHLKVSDLDRAIAFYSGILGFGISQRYGAQAAFLAAGDYHHHIGLNTWESLGATAPPKGHTGLYHTAFLYPSRAALADALHRLTEAQWPITGAADHGVSQAIYVEDPDGNGVELYWDKPQDTWPRNEQGELRMNNTFFDLEDFLAEFPR